MLIFTKIYYASHYSPLIGLMEKIYITSVDKLLSLIHRDNYTLI